jgi:hypothetical protein
MRSSFCQAPVDSQLAWAATMRLASYLCLWSTNGFGDVPGPWLAIHTQALELLHLSTAMAVRCPPAAGRVQLCRPRRQALP